MNELNSLIIYDVDVDEERKIAEKYRVQNVPAYIIIDPNEKIVKSGQGYKSEKEFLLWLRTALL